MPLDDKRDARVAFLTAVGLMAALALNVSCGKFKGPPGDVGAVGATGADAQPCTAMEVPQGVVISCPGQPSYLVANGAQGDQGLPGAQGAAGENGISGAIGPTGVMGQTGSVGPTGPQGLAGTNGSVITAVQFCPSYTTTYASVFPESGLCLSGAIFAVYWDQHNAWLTEVPPGYYDSTSTSAPCSFTVTYGCNVQED